MRGDGKYELAKIMRRAMAISLIIFLKDSDPNAPGSEWTSSHLPAPQWNQGTLQHGWNEEKQSVVHFWRLNAANNNKQHFGQTIMLAKRV